jgi:preprotein translocase subunit SecG
MLLLGQIPYPVIVLLVTAFFCICILLILTVLIQKPAGGGLSGAFGSGAGSGQTAFGAKTGDALTIATIFMFTVFVLGAIGLNYVTGPVVGAPATPVAAGANGALPADQAPDQGAPPAAPEGAAPESKNEAPAAPTGDAPAGPAEGDHAPGDQPQTPPAEQPPTEPK